MREIGNHVRKGKTEKRERKTEGKSKGQSEHTAKTYKRAKKQNSFDLGFKDHFRHEQHLLPVFFLVCKYICPMFNKFYYEKTLNSCIISFQS